MKIAIATKNNGKLKEFEELAKGTSYEFIKIPENINIHPLCIESGINQGKRVNNVPTDAPPAMVAITMGNTQQIKVPEDVNRVKTLNTFGLIFHPHSHINEVSKELLFYHHMDYDKYYLPHSQHQ